MSTTVRAASWKAVGDSDLMEVPDDRHCRATSKRSQKRCGRWAAQGQHVCASHGAKSPQAIEAADKRMAVTKVREALVKMGVAVEQHPIEVLLNQVYEANGNVEFLRARVQELELPAKLSTAAIALLELYNQERDRAAKMAKLALDAGVQERQVQIQAKQAEVLADLIRHVLDHVDLGLSPAQKQQGRLIAARRLRMLSWEGDAEDGTE